MDRRQRRGIRAGRTRIEAKLDLHGKNQKEAFQAIRRFIISSALAGKALVCIVTGRGKRPWEWEKSEGILHNSLREWLRHEEIAPYVINPPSQAGPEHGGDGAWYVRIRRISKE